ncbi:MAG: hypothetical protein ABFD69_07520 [Candidatus Sumerlaeia bacterium]
MVPFRISLTFLILIGFLLQGCTFYNWDPFDQKTLCCPFIEGVGIDPKQPAGSQRYLDLSYRTRSFPMIGKSIEYHYAIPVDDKLVSEYTYQGDKRTADDVLADVTNDKACQDKIGRLVYSKEMYRRGKRLKNTDGPRVIGRAGIPHQNSYTNSPSTGTTQSLPVLIVPYWPDRQSANPQIAQSLHIDKKEQLFDPSARFLMVPIEQPRFRSERYVGNALIIAETPVTIVADIGIIVTAPVWMVLSLLGDLF